MAQLFAHIGKAHDMPSRGSNRHSMSRTATAIRCLVTDGFSPLAMARSTWVLVCSQHSKNLKMSTPPCCSIVMHIWLLTIGASTPTRLSARQLAARFRWVVRLDQRLALVISLLEMLREVSTHLMAKGLTTHTKLRALRPMCCTAQSRAATQRHSSTTKYLSTKSTVSTSKLRDYLLASLVARR